MARLIARVAFWLALVSGTLLALDAVTTLPTVITVVAATVFLLSAVTVVFVATRSRGARTALRWLWELLP